jgi:hypothetical protein
VRLPADWLTGLDGLPGFDREHGVLRYTRESARLRDALGQSLAYFGRAHPLVQRAINRAQRLSDSVCDNRVSAALARDSLDLAVLLTFSAELRSAARVEFRRIVAVLLPMHGEALELSEPERWLQYAELDYSPSEGDMWRKLFAHWVLDRQPEAEAVAADAMERHATGVVRSHQEQLERDVNHLRSWLRQRSDDICGEFLPRTDDLFGEASKDPDWQLLSEPLDRLAAFVADADNLPTRRREANSAVELYQRRIAECAARASLSQPALHQIGMLMLVPPTR